MPTPHYAGEPGFPAWMDSVDADGVADAAALAAHLADTVDAHDATAVSYAGGTGMSATTVEAALDELADEKLDVTTASATYERVGSRLMPLRAVALGDSTVAGGLKSWDGVTVQVGNTYEAPQAFGMQQAGASSWFTHACLLSGGRMLNVVNAGIASDTSAGCLARFATDVTVWAPSVVFLQMGVTNDIQQSIALATTQANIATAVGYARAAGILPVLVTLHPNSSNATFNTNVRTYNAWLRQYAHRNNISFVDPYAALVDTTSTSGAFLAAYTSDNVHANATGAKAAGQRVLNDLSDQGIIGASPAVSRAPFVAHSNLATEAPSQLLPNGLFLTDVNTDGLADNYSVSNATPTLVTDASVLGKAQQLVVSSGNLSWARDTSVDTTTIRVGDKIAFSGLMKVAASSGSLIWSAGINTFGSPAHNSQFMQAVTGLDYDWFPFYVETVIQAGATIVRVYVTSVGGTGTVSLAQVRLQNLTLLGL